MRYGYFDHKNREYVIDHVNVPVSWTNYIGVQDFCTVLSQNAGGYSFYQSPQNHRITRFRQNGVPLDRPGHYVYLRDEQSGDYWSLSWQPVGKPLEDAIYECRHGLSYSKFSCSYNGIDGSQTVFIPLGENVELWDVRVKNTGSKARELSIFSYLEFSFHNIEIDNQNLQMSLYCAGSSYADSIIQYELFYEENAYQYFTASFEPDSFDCLRDKFIGAYRSETNPAAVESGRCSGSFEKGGNHCAALQKKIRLMPGEETRLVFMLGEGGRDTGKAIRTKYSDLTKVDRAKAELADYWDKKLSILQVGTPNEGMNTMLNQWNLYQAEVNVLFSRFASFVEVGGRTGLGYRDTAQDAMCVAHTNPEKTKLRLLQLLKGLTQAGYGLHLFEPESLEPRQKKPAFISPTVIPPKKADEIIHGVEHACSDDALWLIGSICEYVKETGELSFFDEVVSYADGGDGTVYSHMTKILDFSAEQVGKTGICKGLRADWNDCLNLGGGESALTSFLHYYAMGTFIEATEFLGRKKDAQKYKAVMEKVRLACEENLWDGDWFIRGITKNGKKIGSKTDSEGRIHLESNAWAVISNVATHEQSDKCLNAIYHNLATQYGIMLNAPAYSKPDDDIGFITRVYQGVKENGAIFSHSNPWVWLAECRAGHGDRAMEYYNALLPCNQNDIIEIREAEPYSYCQFVMGREHTAFGRARHPWLTGSAGWSYYVATHYMLGVRPGYAAMTVDPCIPADWEAFDVTRVWRGAVYYISVKNPNGRQSGVSRTLLNGAEIVGNEIPAQPKDSVNHVTVYL